jgi:Tol biopolymer transport system component
VGALVVAGVGLIALVAGVLLMNERTGSGESASRTDQPEATPTPIIYEIASPPVCSLQLVSKNGTVQDWGGEIYVQNPDGSSVNVTNSTPASDIQAMWSPDCERIVFSSNRHGPHEIFSVAFDGSDLRQLTFVTNGCCTGDQEPQWSPDGQYISFYSDQRDGIPRVFVMRPDGSDIRPVGDGRNAQWTVDGRIEYTAEAHFSEPPVYLVNPDGSGLLVVYAGTQPPDEHLEEVASLDGKWTAFISTRDNNLELYVTRPDGSDARRLSDTPRADEAYPQWSPDGKRIVFGSTRNGRYELFVINIDGTGLIQLTDAHRECCADHYGTWSPDGKQIAFSSVTPRGAEVSLMRRDGSGRSLLVRGGEVPKWSPDGRRIAFVRPTGVYVINVDGTSEIHIAMFSQPGFQWVDNGSIELQMPDGMRPKVKADGSDLINSPRP